MLIKIVKEVEETIRLSSKEVCEVFEAKLEEFIGPYEMLEGQMVLYDPDKLGVCWCGSTDSKNSVTLISRVTCQKCLDEVLNRCAKDIQVCLERFRQLELARQCRDLVRSFSKR